MLGEARFGELKKHGGNVRLLAERLGLDGGDVVDFSSNINPYGPPKGVIDAVKNAIERICEYPEQDAESLVADIARLLGISSENIVAGNGTIELMHLLPRLFEPKKALLIIPSFTEYELALLKANASIERRVSFSAYEAEEVLSGPVNADMVVIGNPNNPCGYRINKSVLLAAIDSNPHCMWVIDEAFIDFVEGGLSSKSIAVEATNRHNLIALRSLTKIYSIAGLRIGYAIASKGVVEKVRAEKYPWSVNTMAIESGRAALKDGDFIENSISLLYKEAQRLHKVISGIDGLFAYKPEANYILVRIEKEMPATSLQEALLRRGLAIRDCSTYTGMDEKHFRVAVKRPEDNERLIISLKEIMRTSN